MLFLLLYGGIMFTRKKIHGVGAILILLGVVFLTGCGGAYKGSGQYKRDLLLDRIDKVRKCHETQPGS